MYRGITTGMHASLRATTALAAPMAVGVTNWWTENVQIGRGEAVGFVWDIYLQTLTTLENGKADSPALPQPPATALAMPTTVGENMMDDQNWQMTKVAREHPMNRRSMMYPTAPSTTAIQNTGTAVIASRNP